MAENDTNYRGPSATAFEPPEEKRRIKVKFKIIGILIIFLFFAGLGAVFYLWQHSTQRQVQARIDEFAQAIVQNQQSKARELWELNQYDRRAGMSERRERIISDFISAGIQPDYEVLKVVWWSTCCEPRPIQDSRNAGRAQMTVQFTDKNEHPISYTFDIHTREAVTPSPELPNFILRYLGDAWPYPSREWVIREIYLPDEGPLR